MRILLSLESEDSITDLCGNLCNLLRIVEDHGVYIDIVHVYEPISTKKHRAKEEELIEIKRNEHKLKVKTLAAWENHIESYLQDKLDKTALVNSFLFEGDYKERLLRHITFQRYDLLVLNPGKKKNMEVILQGRNTYWIIDNLEIPVLILPSYLNDHAIHPNFEIICFVDELATYSNMSKSDLLGNFFQTKIQYVHFGREQFHENVEVINSSDPLRSIAEKTKSSDVTQVFALHHKNKGNFLNFLDKSFTKNIIKTLDNPLLIY